MKFVVKTVNTGIEFLVYEGETFMGRSEVYTQAASCKNGIDSVQKNSVNANVEDLTVEDSEKFVNPKIELFTDADGKYRYRLKASNGEIIFASVPYAEKADCKAGIKHFIKEASKATIEKAE